MKSIKINEKTYERLVKNGKYEETIDGIINRKLDDAEKCLVTYEE